MTTITLPPLPMHPEPYAYTWSAQEAAAIERYRLAVAQAVIKACEKACVAQASRFLTSPRDIYVAHECAAAIRAIKLEEAQ